MNPSRSLAVFGRAGLTLLPIRSSSGSGAFFVGMAAALCAVVILQRMDSADPHVLEPSLAQGSTPSALIPSPAWRGSVRERPAILQPVFANTRKGHVAFISFLIASLQKAGLTHEQAVLFTAHKARESGYGRFVFNYNFGNIKTGSPVRGPYFLLTDRRGFRAKYRAYDSAEQGIVDNVNLVKNSPIYKKSWALLQMQDPGWYGQLGLDGYYEGPPDPKRPHVHTRHTRETIKPVQQEYNGIVALVRRYEGMSPLLAFRSVGISLFEL